MCQAHRHGKQAAADAAPAEPGGVVYTCPMHPEVRQDRPGNCPRCGMTLEPLVPLAGGAGQPELADFTRRFWLGLPLTVMVAVLAMGAHQVQFIPDGWQSWIELLLAAPVVLWAGWPSQTSAAIRSLLDMAPRTARRIRPDGSEEDVPVAHVHVGDMLRVRPGEQVPVDGIVIEGGSAVDEPMLTGEPIPVAKAAGDKLIGTIMNAAGALVMRSERVGAETMLARIVHMVAMAQRSRAPMQRMADVVAGYFVMAQAGIGIDALLADAERLRGSGASVMHLAVEGRLAGLLALSDPVKASTGEALASLQRDGIRVVMATGDGMTTARLVAARLGIDEVHGEATPADKLALVEQLQAQGRVMAMAGDGINDAPALARADVGIAMGTGTDVAMHSAQVTLVKGDLRGIAVARAMSVATVRNMRQNLGFALIYNALGVPVAAGVLYPWTGWLLSPLIAGLAMSLSSVSVIGNALRLRAGAIG